MTINVELRRVAQSVQDAVADADTLAAWKTKVREWAKEVADAVRRQRGDGDNVVRSLSLFPMRPSSAYRFALLGAITDAVARASEDASAVSVDPFADDWNADPNDFVRGAPYAALVVRVRDEIDRVWDEAEVEALHSYLDSALSIADGGIAPTHSQGLNRDSEPTGAAETESETPALSERKYLILQSLLELKATTADARQSAKTIAEKAEGTAADVNGFKGPIADLTRGGYLATKEGRGGGCWLTLKGQNVAEKL